MTKVRPWSEAVAEKASDLKKIEFGIGTNNGAVERISIKVTCKKHTSALAKNSDTHDVHEVMVSQLLSATMKSFPLLLLVSTALSSCSGFFQPAVSVSTATKSLRFRKKFSSSPLLPVVKRTKQTTLNNSASATTATTATTTNSLDSFDYKMKWYPVLWSRDLPFNRPTRVTLFDVNYVLAKTTTTTTKQQDDDDNKTEEEVSYVAMLDECPHKKVALSEGRVTECGSGYIQCSYHGWTFDGRSGECVEIPQTVIAAAAAAAANAASSSKKNGKEGIVESLPADTTNTASLFPPDREHKRIKAERWVSEGQTNTAAAVVAADTTTTKKPTTNKRRREDGTAIAITEVQGMLWISPFLTPLEALAATSNGILPPPPRVPEIDIPGYKTQVAIRDFPIDWTVLMENIMDPDHGYFAHSSSGTAPMGFDWYSSDGVDNVMKVKEEFQENNNGGGGGVYKIVSEVNAVSKLGKYNAEVRNPTVGVKKKKSKKKDVDVPPPKLATTTFVAPSLIYMGRRDNSTSTSNFLTAFWVSPTGTGRSRFMSAAISKAPFVIPRWIVHMQINNFLDQDTFLLLGQHRAVLKREAEGYLKEDENDDDTTTATTDSDAPSTTNNVRKSTYVYRSPSEKLPVKIGKYFDATLSKVPNRKEALMAWYNRNNNDNKLFESWPNRETVLDRYEQHTKICPDSMDLVNRCEKVMARSKTIGLAMILLKLVWKTSPAAASVASVAASFQNPFVVGVGPFISSISSTLRFLTASAASYLVQTKSLLSILTLMFASHYIAARIKREFFFKFNDQIHHDDIKFIANNWADL